MTDKTPMPAVDLTVNGLRADLHDAECAGMDEDGNWLGPCDCADAAELPPYVEGTTSERNTGRACWSCAGLDDHAPGPRCIYPDSHRAAKQAAGDVEALLYESILTVVDGNAQTNERIAELATAAALDVIAEVRRAAGEQIAQAIEANASDPDVRRPLAPDAKTPTDFINDHEWDALTAREVTR